MIHAGATDPNHLPLLSRKRDVAGKVGVGQDRVCLKSLIVRHAEKSCLDHFDVKVKTDFGPTSPGIHTAPKIGPGYNSGKLSPHELNMLKLQRQAALADDLDRVEQAQKAWRPPPHMGLGSVPAIPPRRRPADDEDGAADGASGNVGVAGAAVVSSRYFARWVAEELDNRLRRHRPSQTQLSKRSPSRPQHQC